MRFNVDRGVGEDAAVGNNHFFDQTVAKPPRPLPPPPQVRYLIYAKQLDNTIDIVSPATLGGLKSPDYLALNPHGKMPLLVLPCGTALPESDTIARYLLDEYAAVGPSFDPGTARERARANLAARTLDTYISPIQGCLYKAMDAGERAAQLAAIDKQLDVLEDILAGGPRVCGSEQSLGDAALFPTLVFILDIAPKIYGWADPLARRPKLAAHWQEMSEADAAGKRVVGEMRDGLKSWWDAKRWDELKITDQVKADPAAFKH